MEQLARSSLFTCYQQLIMGGIYRLMNTALQHTFPIILASQSQARSAILRNAGVQFTIQPAYIDERAVKLSAKEKQLSVEQCTQDLAIAKAMKISERFSDAYVIGADQIMICENRWFDKAESLVGAKQQLGFLRGKTHTLITAACVVKANVVLWQALSNPQLKMRRFSDEFIDDYLDKLGDEVLRSVGCYQLEGMGIQLFDEVDGDMFSIMGLPIIHLLHFLRAESLVNG